MALQSQEVKAYRQTIFKNQAKRQSQDSVWVEHEEEHWRESKQATVINKSQSQESVRVIHDEVHKEIRESWNTEHEGTQQSG